MKALVDRLEWVRLYLTGQVGGISASEDAALKSAVIDELIGAIAIAEAIPEITLVPIDPPARTPPERIIDL